jgi:Ribonucleotide reductase inhibitor
MRDISYLSILPSPATILQPTLHLHLPPDLCILSTLCVPFILFIMPSVVSRSSTPTSTSSLSKRRRFQTPITHYFNSTSTDSSSADAQSASHNHYSAATFSATPVVPAKVQASLLSVGMRVRKSVADGYKTQLALKSEKALPPASVGEVPAIAPPRSSGTGNSELAPFSGVPKSSYDPHYNNQLVTDDGDAYSLPPSSQESNTSSASFSSTVNGQKRALESDIFVDDDGWEDDPGSGLRQETPVGRHILSPSLGQQRRHMLGLHDAVNQTTMDLDDFEEASFLRRREEVDADYRMDCA